MDKLLTIIVPAFDMEAYLPTCLGSLLIDDCALFASLDVIVVNDGSTDRTGEIAHGFARRHPGVFAVIDKPNGHYGSCINAALPRAKGRFVKILDADDAFDTRSLGLFLAKLRALPEDVDAVLTDFVCVDSRGTVLSVKRYPFEEGRDYTVEALLEKRCEMSMHAVCYRIGLLREIGYRQTEGVSYTDTEWFYLPMAAVKRMRCFGMPLYRYCRGREGQSMERETWIANRHVLIRMADEMVSRYVALRACGRYSRRYMESQILRAFRMVSEIYLYSVPYDETGPYWVFAGKLSGFGFVGEDLAKACASCRAQMKFRYLDFLIGHPRMRKPGLAFFRLYARLMHPFSPHASV